MDGPDEADGDDRGETQPEDGSDGQDEQADAHHLAVPAVGLRLGLRGDPEHLAASSVEVPVELVAELVESGQERPILCRVTPVERPEELRRQDLVPAMVLA